MQIEIPSRRFGTLRMKPHVHKAVQGGGHSPQKGGGEMEPKDYVVVKIEGEYAYLREIGGNEDEVFIALFLLPLGVDVGTRLHYEWLTYTIVD